MTQLSDCTTQLELGITPLSLELKEGLKVAFFVDVKRWRQKRRRKRKEVNIGVVKRFNGSGVVIEGITLPGMYNRAPDKLFEVHKDLSLEGFLNESS
jgi:hypothetical protein